MSTIKKWIQAIIVIIATAAMVFMASCAPASMELSKKRGNDTTTTTSSATKETAAESKVKGTIYETDRFSVLQPDGWQATAVSDGVIFTKGDYTVNVEIGDAKGFTEDIIKQWTEGIAKQQNGTPVVEVPMFGSKFFQTTYTNKEGKSQTQGWVIVNGELLALAMAGKDHQNNVEIKATLDSIKFK